MNYKVINKIRWLLNKKNLFIKKIVFLYSVNNQNKIFSTLFFVINFFFFFTPSFFNFCLLLSFFSFLLLLYWKV